MHAESFRSLAGNGKWDEYCNLLCNKGPDWWFNLEIPRLIEHLQPIQQNRHARISQDDVTGFPPRLILLSELIKPVMSIEVLNCLFVTLKSDNDLRGASVCAGAGVHAIWERGYGLGELDVWYQRIKDLLSEPEELLDSLARASLLGSKGLVEVTGLGDTALAVETLIMQRSCAEKARSSSLQTYGAFFAGLLLFF